MNVIILDFDGPIFPEKVKLYPQNKGEIAKENCKKLNLYPHIHYWYADPFAIAILNELYSICPYQLVISSSWADDKMHQKQQIIDLLNTNGLTYELHEDWRTSREKVFDGHLHVDKERHDQIEEWLNRHPEVDNYLIMDDVYSAPFLHYKDTYLTCKILQENVFLAEPQNGYTYRQFEEMQSHLRQWKKPTLKLKAL